MYGRAGKNHYSKNINIKTGFQISVIGVIPCQINMYIIPHHLKFCFNQAFNIHIDLKKILSKYIELLKYNPGNVFKISKK